MHCAVSVGTDSALTRDNGLGVMAREAAIEIEMEFTTSHFMHRRSRWITLHACDEDGLHFIGLHFSVHAPDEDGDGACDLTSCCDPLEEEFNFTRSRL